MIIVGLTGGIATGKSTVTKLLRQHNVTVIDCDEIAHAIVSKGRWGYRRVLKAFGQDILTPAGDIDRDKLGDLVFNDASARRKLNSATHLPVAVELLRELLLQWISLTSVAVVDMPLLFETGTYRWMWTNVFVTCDHGTEVNRLMKRDSCTQQQAEAKVAAQMPLSTKSAKAQLVIDNSQDLAHIELQVQKLASTLQQLTWLGILTSPVVLVGTLWLAMRLVRK